MRFSRVISVVPIFISLVLGSCSKSSCEKLDQGQIVIYNLTDEQVIIIFNQDGADTLAPKSTHTYNQPVGVQELRATGLQSNTVWEGNIQLAECHTVYEWLEY